LTSLRNSEKQIRATQKSPLELERGKIALKKRLPDVWYNSIHAVKSVFRPALWFIYREA